MLSCTQTVFNRYQIEKKYFLVQKYLQFLQLIPSLSYLGQNIFVSFPLLIIYMQP